MSNTQQPEALRLAHALGGGELIDDSTEWADTLHAAATAAPEPQGWKLVPVNLLERIQESLGSFVSDQGW